MKWRKLARPWARVFKRGMTQALAQALIPRLPTASRVKAPRRPKVTVRPQSAAKPRRQPAGQGAAPGTWQPGVAPWSGGARRYRLYTPPDVARGEALPLLVMLHGCGQDAQGLADSTRMNVLAHQQRFMVLYPEQDRLANSQGCWNWFGTRSGRAGREMASVLAAIDRVCALHGGSGTRVAVAGLSAGAGLAALLALHHPQRFCAVAMHSGVAPGMAHSAITALAAMRGRRTAAALPVQAVRAAQHGKSAGSALTDLAPSTSGLPPLLVIQGLNDTVVAPSNALAAVQAWAGAVGAKPQVRRFVQRGQRYPVAITDYCMAKRTCASLVEVAGLGHAWSGGAAARPYADPRGPDASRMVWTFVRQHLQHLA